VGRYPVAVPLRSGTPIKPALPSTVDIQHDRMIQSRGGPRQAAGLAEPCLEPAGPVPGAAVARGVQPPGPRAAAGSGGLCPLIALGQLTRSGSARAPVGDPAADGLRQPPQDRSDQTLADTIGTPFQTTRFLTWALKRSSKETIITIAHNAVPTL